MALAPERADERAWPAVLPAGFALAATLYHALRYGQRYAEHDTAGFVRFARDIEQSGALVPPHGAYPHGFVYQALTVTVAEITGLSVASVLLFALPILTIAAALAAFIAFRALLGNAVLAGLATLLLFIQPEFLFVMLRGNHEKATYVLLLLTLFILTATLTRQPAGAWIVSAILAFYLLAWTLVATNSFFASTLTAGLVLALAGALVVARAIRRAPLDSATTRRLTLTALATFAILFTFVAYIYAPAEANFHTLRTMIDRLAVLFLSAEPAASPFAGISIGWVSPWIYPILTLFNWIVLAGAAVTWGWLAVRLWRDGIQCESRGVIVLWLLSAAFAVQVALGLIVDHSGFLAANLQIRLFPIFMMFAIPLAALGAARVFNRKPDALDSRIAIAGVSLALMAFATLGVLKATNDPLVSNKWTFYKPSERAALAWFERSATGQEIWIGFDERLREMQSIHQPPDPERQNVYRFAQARESTRYVVISDVMERRSVRLRTSTPDIRGHDLIYDNGDARVYRRATAALGQP